MSKQIKQTKQVVLTTYDRSGVLSEYILPSEKMSVKSFLIYLDQDMGEKPTHIRISYKVWK